eukprot:scaffold26163_cov62-Isochrysis_galbana.AAC.1
MAAGGGAVWEGGAVLDGAGEPPPSTAPGDPPLVHLQVTIGTQIPPGRTPPGGIPPGGIPAGAIPPGDIPVGGIPPGHIPVGGIPAGDIEAGRSALAGELRGLESEHHALAHRHAALSAAPGRSRPPGFVSARPSGFVSAAGGACQRPPGARDGLGKGGAQDRPCLGGPQ